MCPGGNEPVTTLITNPRKEADACRFRACAVLSDIATDSIKTRLAQIWSQMEMVGCVSTWALEKLARPNVKSHSLLSVMVNGSWLTVQRWLGPGRGPQGRREGGGTKKLGKMTNDNHTYNSSFFFVKC